jgi:hypothetical protein
LLKESLDWLRDAGRRAAGALHRLEREWVEEFALGLRMGSEVWVEVDGSGRRWERWFVKRFRRTDDVEMVLG